MLLMQIKECAAEELGKGYLMSCLVDHRSNISDYQCKQYITKMTSIIFSDYRLICGFMDNCRDDINTLHCGSISTGDKVRKPQPVAALAFTTMRFSCWLALGLDFQVWLVHFFSGSPTPGPRTGSGHKSRKNGLAS